MSVWFICPKPYQVVQRDYDLQIKFSSDMSVSDCRYRITPHNTSSPQAWTALSLISHRDCYTAKVGVEAGGWYSLELRLSLSDGTVKEEKIEPFGVGEVFVVAGQSHATNSNDKRFNITERDGRITVYEPLQENWRTAHDCQPCYDSSDYNKEFGSIWPCTMDRLFEKINVPIGMTNAAYGATSLSQWMPGTTNFEHLETCCKAAGTFRCILWQQGESDVILKTPAEEYISMLIHIRESLNSQLGFKTDWLLAKSTIHPSVYDNPEQEGVIRAAIDRLCLTEGFHMGPDTDKVGWIYRDKGEHSGHLTAQGQVIAGNMWAEVLADFIVKH